MRSPAGENFYNKPLLTARRLVDTARPRDPYRSRSGHVYYQLSAGGPIFRLSHKALNKNRTKRQVVKAIRREQVAGKA